MESASFHFEVHIHSILLKQFTCTVKWTESASNSETMTIKLLHGDLSPVHSIDADAQLSVNIKDTALTQAASLDADADAGIEFIPASASTSASASYCAPGFSFLLMLKTLPHQ